MSPRRRDPEVRAQLVETAARVLAEEGPPALTVRRLARETGTSTMSIYTWFGSMDELRREVRRDGFARLDAELDGVGEPVAGTGDPVADLVTAGEVYFRFALADPHRYRAMFVDRPLDDDRSGAPTFDRLVAAVRACVRAGRFRVDDPGQELVWAAQVWSMRHGMVSMALSGALPTEQARHVLGDMVYRLLIGYGDAPADARASIRRAAAGTPAPAVASTPDGGAA